MRFRNLKKQTKNKNTKIKKIAEEFQTARFTDRIKAFITDMFMIYIPILYTITYLFLDGKDDFQSSQLAPLIGVAIYGIIYAIFVSRLGQTPGKKAYQIKIVDNATHKNIGFFRAIFRFLSFLVSATFLLGLLLPLFRKDNRSLHDLMSNTIVIIEKR